MKRFVLISLCCSLPLGAHAADADGNFAAKGVGQATCAHFVEQVDNKSQLLAMYGGWLDGYLTAVNQAAPETYDVAPWQSTQLLARLIETHCRRNPEHNFFVVTNALVGQELMPRRLIKSSPREEVKVGDVTEIHYQDTLRKAQEALKARGHYSGGVDGKFGPRTQKAFEAFQKEAGLQVTGIPDQLTLLRLLGGPGAGQQ